MHEELRIARIDGMGQTRIGKDGEFGLPCSCRVLLSEDLSYLASSLQCLDTETNGYDNNYY